MKNIAKKVVFGVLMLTVVIVACLGVGYVTKSNELAHRQEYAAQQERTEARDELQRLKGKVQILQYLSAKTDFSSITVQDELKKQLKDAVAKVEKSDNQYLEQVEIPIEETNVFVACDGVIAYINYWIEEIG